MIFEDAKYCQSAFAEKGICEYLNSAELIICKKYGTVLKMFGFVEKCPECIEETKEEFPELFI